MHRLNGYDSDQHTPYRNIDEDAGGSTAAVGSTNSLVVGSSDVGGLDALVEDSTLGHLELAFI